jgi:hypothetical protein
MKRTIFIAAWFILPLLTTAQYSTDTTYKKYTSGLIYRIGGTFMKGNQKINFQELRNEFSMSHIGTEQYNIARKKLTTAKIFLYTSLACSIAGGASINSNRNLGLGLLAAQLVSLSISAQSRNAGNKFLDQAIQIRNKDYLFPGPH